MKPRELMTAWADWLEGEEERVTCGMKRAARLPLFDWRPRHETELLDGRRAAPVFGLLRVYELLLP
jgi:hypothetical protein